MHLHTPVPDDFVVGARYNDAGDAGITDAGAAYIFFGDSRGNLVRNLDPKINADGQIYGVNASTQLGYALAIGDYDGDGAGDIVVTGYAADGPLNARDDCGEVYLFYGAAPPVKINSVELLDSGSEPTVIIYSNYETYTFRVNVTMIIGADDLEKVELTLDPGGEDLTYKYNHLTTQFSKVQDTGGLTKLESKLMDAVQTGPFYWELDFKLEFDWEFPASGLLAVKIKAEGIRCPESEKTFSNVFRVEDDLELNGALKVYDDENVLLADGDWIAGGETVAFTGLTAVYEGTTDIYPPDGEFTIKVSDNDGIWTNLTGSGDPMHIDATVKLITDPIDVFKVAITAPPSASPGAERIINLSIDAEDPEPPAVIVFKRKTTTSDTVTAINRTTFVMEWGDGSDKFSGIRGYYYSLVNNEGFKDGTYTTDTSATLSDMPTGQQNMYIWAIDIAGNIGKAASGTIFIDLTSPKFSDFEPAGTDWLTEAVFTCEIELDDGEGVGVDTGTIVYKISTRGAGAYDAWLTATDIEPLGGNKLKISVDIDDEFIEGEDNWIKFKAMDLTGNQMESPDYNLKLDVSKIEYDLHHHHQGRCLRC